MNYLRNNSVRQKALGLKNVELLTRDDIRKVLPQLRSDDIIGGSFCPTDGFVDPESVMTGFMARAIERGAQLMRGTEVTAICTEHAAVSGVLTTNGAVQAPIVVNAAGPWAAGPHRTILRTP
jgi:glycine/D-amino acid oxidase-like deaminating enzyme